MNISIHNIDMELNGIPIVSWSDDADALMFPGDATFNNYRKGATGLLAFFSSSERRGGLVQVKLLPTGVEIAPLMQQVDRWRSNDILNWEGTVTDRSTQASAQLLRGQMHKAPKFWTYGDDSVANMIFQVMFTDIIGDFDKVVIP